MQRFIAVLMALSLVASLAGAGKKTKPATPKSQIEFGINALDLALLTGLITHAEERGLDPTPARLAM